MDVVGFEYETQYFSFHPRILIDEVYNAFYENVLYLLDQLKQYLTNEFANVIEPFNIIVQTDSLLRELVRRLDKAIDKLEVYLNGNVFKIPKYVVLQEDMIHITNSVTESDQKKLDDEIEELKQQILETRLQSSFLKSKILEQKRVLKALNEMKESLEEMISNAEQIMHSKEMCNLTLTKCTELCELMKSSFIKIPVPEAKQGSNSSMSRLT
ncbi:Protein MIS12-like protein, partial [Stegodyphus mimosarum]